MNRGGIYGVLAEFETAEALAEALRRTRAAGYARIDAYSPFPVEGTARALGYRASLLPLLGLAAALIGGTIMYFTQYWMNGIDYPLNVGGRPLHSWPAFIPNVVIVGILWAAVAITLGMLAFNRLPRLDHPLFNVPGFERATQQRFFLCIRADDPRYEEAEAMRYLRDLGPSAVDVVPWSTEA